jgi:hypothetical protein
MDDDELLTKDVEGSGHFKVLSQNFPKEAEKNHENFIGGSRESRITSYISHRNNR